MPLSTPFSKHARLVCDVSLHPGALARPGEAWRSVGAFCHVLHVSWMALWISVGATMNAHRNLRPRQLEIAQQVADDHVLSKVAADGGHVIDALEASGPRSPHSRARRSTEQLLRISGSREQLGAPISK